MNRNYLLALSLCCTGYIAQSQITSDALRFSDTHPTLTARALGVGNALGAMGSDIASINLNPAGVAIFRNSEFSISPLVNIQNSQANYAEDIHRDGKTGLNLGSIGAVFTGVPYNSDLRSVSVGFSYARTGSFNERFSFDGTTFGSRIVAFTENAQGWTPNQLNPFEDQLAYDAYLIDNPGGGTDYVGALTDSNYVYKNQSTNRIGGTNEFSAVLGVNLNDKLYVGFGIGMTFLNYRATNIYSENEETGTLSFQNMTFTETRRVRGSGFNGRLGFIYRIHPLVRFGLHAKTPTGFGLNENYYTSIDASVIYFDTLRVNTLASPEARYPFRLSTPWTVGANVGILLGKVGKRKIGFLAIDIDYLTYGSTRYAVRRRDPNASTNESYLNGLNDNLDVLLRGAVRARIGAEFVHKDLRFRFGYNFQSSPYKVSVENISDLRHAGSIGIGYRRRAFFFDLSYQHTFRDFLYVPYFTQSNVNPQEALINSQIGIVMLTVGFRFGDKLDD